MKKVLTLILSLCLAASLMTGSALADVSAVNTASTVYDFQSGSIPAGFVTNYTDGGSTIAVADTDSTNKAVSITTTASTKDYNFIPNFSLNSLSAVSYDIMLLAETDTKSAYAIFAPNLEVASAGVGRWYSGVAGLYKTGAQSYAFRAPNSEGSASIAAAMQNWYTVKYVFDTVEGTAAVYVTDKSTGIKSHIGTFMSFNYDTLKRINLTDRGNASFYIDNITLYKTAVNKTDITVDAFNTAQGFAATVKLSDTVARADVMIDGEKVETVINSANGLYSVIDADKADAIKKTTVSLVCYDSAGNITETIEKEVSVTGKIYRPIYSSSAEYSIPKTSDLIFVNNVGIKSRSVVELSYTIKSDVRIYSFTPNPLLFDSSYWSNGYANGASSSVIKGGAVVGGGATAAGDSFRVRDIYDSSNDEFMYYRYVSVNGGPEILSASGTMNGRDYKYGFHACRAKATMYDDSVQPIVTDVSVKTVTMVEPVVVGSYVNFAGETVAYAGNVAENAKSVVIDCSGIDSVSTANVSLYCDDVLAENVSASFSEEGMLTVSPTAFAHGAYKVVISGVTAPNGEAIEIPFVANFSVYPGGVDISDIALTRSGSSYTASVDCNNYNASAVPASLIFAAYEGSKLNDIAVSASNSMTTGKSSLSATLYGIENGTKLKAMLWSGLDYAKPLKSPTDSVASINYVYNDIYSKAEEAIYGNDTYLFSSITSHKKGACIEVSFKILASEELDIFRFEPLFHNADETSTGYGSLDSRHNVITNGKIDGGSCEAVVPGKWYTFRGVYDSTENIMSVDMYVTPEGGTEKHIFTGSLIDDDSRNFRYGIAAGRLYFYTNSDNEDSDAVPCTASIKNLVVRERVIADY